MAIDLGKIGAALVAADDAFRADHSVIFGSEANRLKSFFAFKKRRFKAWDRSGACLFRGCQKPSIARSHTVQRSKVLERIAEAGHVLMPEAGDDGQIRMRRIGIGLASTFPGFCHDHELLFAEFEEDGLIKGPRHVGLQMMRTVCREIARVRFTVESLELSIAEYRATRSSYFNDSLRLAAGSAGLSDISIEGEALEVAVEAQLASQKSTLRVLEGRLFTETMDYIEKGKLEPACTAMLLPSDDPSRPPLALPVALSGFAHVPYSDGAGTHRAPCTLAIIPQDGATLVSVGTIRKHRKILPLLEARMATIFNMLSLIESWMVHGTDHWFIRPSTWVGLPSARQADILAGIASTDGAAGVSAAPSIFDDLRRMGITEIEAQLSPRAEDRDPRVVAILDTEKAKLTVA